MNLRILLCLLALLGAAPAVADAEFGDPGGGATRADPYAGAVARTVTALVEYSRWPGPTNPVNLCVAGPAVHAGALGSQRLSDGREMVRRNVAATASALTGCDVVYFGEIGLAPMRQLTAAVRGRGILTIAEADPDCRSEAMVCLVYQQQGLSFQLNVDAVARSGLRLDPRVLRMARGGA